MLIHKNADMKTKFNVKSFYNGVCISALHHENMPTCI